MALRKLDTIIRSNNMKPQAWIIVILAAMTAGCAVSNKNGSSIRVAEPSANRQNRLIANANAAPAPGNNAEPSVDEDFGLLEEDLAEQKVSVADPLEPLNRIMFGVNDILYFWVLKPTAEGYKAVAPEPVRLGVRNFFQNLTTPVRLVSCLLQGKNEEADTEFRRFTTNTTVGILGFGDPAKDKYGREPGEEDLGQSLAKFGLGNGCYLVLPVLGPSTARDSVGLVGGWYMNPVRYVEPVETSYYINAGKVTNENTFRIGEYEAFKDAAIDPYIAMREAYIQYRNKQIKE